MASAERFSGFGDDPADFVKNPFDDARDRKESRDGQKPFFYGFFPLADHILRKRPFRDAAGYHGNLPRLILVRYPAQKNRQDNQADYQTDRKADQAVVCRLIGNQEAPHAHGSQDQERQNVPAKSAQRKTKCLLINRHIVH
jgi:hypothetical protein